MNVVVIEWDVEKPKWWNIIEKNRIRSWAKRTDAVAKSYGMDSGIPDWCFK